MMWIVVIGLPVVLLSAGLFALSCAMEPPKQASQPQPAADVKPTPLVLFQPMVWTTDLRQVSVDELVAGIEEQLRQRRQAVRQSSRKERRDTELV